MDNQTTLSVKTDNKLFIGMDLHKNTSTFCVKDYSGKLIISKKVNTDKNDVVRFLNSVKNKSDDISLVLEPVSQWYYYADLIEKMDIQVKLAHPMRVKAIASARIKTDKIDASVLADLLRANLLPEAYFSPLDVRGWKERCRFRASLIHQRTQIKNKVHAILFKHSLRHKFTDLFGKQGRAWLSSLKLSEPFRGNLDKYLSLIDIFDDLVSKAEKLIEQEVKNHTQAELLVSIPGIAYVSALTIISEIGNINRFPTCKQLQSYAGLVPSTYASGDKMMHGRITKQGSKWLRYIMIEAAHHQPNCRKIPGFGFYYNDIKKRKGNKTAAVATARKLLAVVWRLIRDNRPYETIDPRSRKFEAVGLKNIVF